MTTLYLCGAGNPEGVRLAQRVNRERPRWDRIVLLDDDASRHGQTVLGIEILGRFSTLAEVDPGSAEVANLVARTADRRAAAREKILGHGVPFACLVDPSVDTSGVELGADVVVYQNAVLGPEVRIGDGTVVFMGGTVGHASSLASCCIVAPNAVINARVQVDEGAYIGTNASILPELVIGAHATVAAGSAVMQDVPAGATVMGVPAKVLISGRAKQRLVVAEEPADPKR